MDEPVRAARGGGPDRRARTDDADALPVDACPIDAWPIDAWPLDDRPGFLARRMHQIHVSLFSERCAAFRITPLQYSLLSQLYDLREADQTTLANAVALDRTTTTGALKRLAARGLVERSMSPTDRRAQVCRLTEDGAALHRAMERAVRDAHAMTVAALTPPEQDLLMDLLRRVVASHDHRRGQADIS